MSVNKEAERQAMKTANKTIKDAGKAMTNLAQMMIDHADYSDTGRRNAKITVSDADNLNKLDVYDGDVPSLAKIKAKVDPDKEDSVEQDAYYNKQHIDSSIGANAVTGTVKKSYRGTDMEQGILLAQRYGAVLGKGTLSKHVATANLKTRMRFRNEEQADNVHNVLGIKKIDEQTGKFVVNPDSKMSIDDFVTSASKHSVIDDFNKNKHLIDGYLQSRGINAANLTEHDINKIIGISGKASYYETYSVFHSGDSKVFKGEYRDNLYLLFDKLFKNNTGVTDSSSHHVVIDDDLRYALNEKRWQLQMQARVDQIQKGPGGAKNLLNNWKKETLRDTDVESGMQSLEATLSSLKATAIMAEGTVATAATTAVSTVEAAGRAGASIGRTGNKVAGKIYSHGDAARSAKWNVQTSKFNNVMDNVTAKSKYIGRESRRAIGQNSKAAISFTSKSSSQKVKFISSKVGNGAKWTVTNTVGKTRPGKAVANTGKKTKDRVDNFKKGISRIGDRIYDNTKLLRTPFSAANTIKRAMTKVAIATGTTVAAIFAFSVIALIAVSIIPILVVAVQSFFASIIPNAFLSDSSSGVTYQVGQAAVSEMLTVQTDFLKEIEDYMDQTCTLTDAEGNKLHEHHNAYFLKYMGDNTTDFENLSNVSTPTADTYTTSTGSVGNYSIKELYKTVISLATVATGNEADDADFYKEYCSLLLKKILHTAKFNDSADGRVAIIVTDAGLTDAMKLDPKRVDALWCDEFLPAVDDGWMHSHGANSLEYSEWLRSEENYNTWHGWNVEDMASYDWALTLWEMGDDDWGDLNVVLPGNIGGGDNGTAFSPTLVSNTTDKLREQGYSEYRIKAIEIALNEVGKHVYGVRNDNSHFPYILDCSDFISGVLLEAGVPGAQDATTGGMVSLYPHLNTGDEVVPGTIMVKNASSGSVVNGQVVSSNHVVMYIGAVEGYGDYCVVECSTKTTYKNGERDVFVDGVSVSGFNTFEQLRSKYPYSYYLNPYGD